MSDDWFDLPPIPAPGAGDETVRHLRVLRSLLEQDPLSRADWEGTLRDLAAMVRGALEAHSALVALWLEEAARWTAVTPEGGLLVQDDIARLGSRSALDRVRETGEPLLSTSFQSITLDSESIRQHQVEWFLVAPLYWWDVTQAEPRRQFGGCLYAHRTAGQPPFTPRDVDILLDISRLVQPTLNMLRCLRQVQIDLEHSRRALQTLQAAEVREHRLGAYRSLDPWFGRQVIEPLRRVSGADRVNILLLGPTGAGKTHLAEAYHLECPRRGGPFVVLDCAQVTSVETLSAELFGYAPDSGYANAPKGGRPGKAQLAHRGTLFIDEIACLPAELQQKLLRLIERGEFSPLGSSELKRVELQFVCATNEDLQALVRQGRFREDLYWRISDITVTLPPLSDRPTDIPYLADLFLRKACERAGRPGLDGFAPLAMRQLLEHDWGRAGNVRGLERTIYRSVLMAPEGARRLEAQDLVLQQIQNGPGDPDSASRARGQAGTPGHPAAGGSGPGNGKGSTAISSDGRGRAGRPAIPGRSGLEADRLEAVKAAIREHGYASAAARALGMSYRELTWQLHKVGLSVRDVLAERD